MRCVYRSPQRLCTDRPCLRTILRIGRQALCTTASRVISGPLAQRVSSHDAYAKRRPSRVKLVEFGGESWARRLPACNAIEAANCVFPAQALECYVDAVEWDEVASNCAAQAATNC